MTEKTSSDGDDWLFWGQSKRSRTVESGAKLYGEVKLPEYLKPFFWDVDFEKLSCRSSPRFIMSRLMEHGDEPSLRFLMRTFSREELRGTLAVSRSLSRRSRRFWAVLLEVEGEPCSVRRYPTPFGELSWD
jgi:hypothetical protein